MTDEVSVDEVARLLSDALNKQHLPKKVQNAGKRILDRLTAPIRITLLGPSTTEKLLIVNALAARSVVPRNQRMPTFEVCRGDVRKLRVTLRNGQGKDLQGHDFDALPDLRPSFVQVITDETYFRTVTLLAVITDGSAGQQLAAASWAAKRTDIAIWVTYEFSTKQQTLWSRMPETLHDHCFLVPIIGSSEPNDAHGASRTPTSGSDQFLGVYPLTIDDAKGSIDPHGVDVLSKELKRCVDLGLQDDLDRALLFLNRRTSEWDSDSGRDVMSLADENGDDRASNLDLLSLESFGDYDLCVRQDEVQGQERAALDLITTEAKEMLSLLGSEDDDAASALTERCSETAQNLCELITANNPLYDTVSRTAEYLVLFDLESNEDSPENAVTALLQVKRAIEVELAA